jgi:hypothetical protein
MCREKLTRDSPYLATKSGFCNSGRLRSLFFESLAEVSDSILLAVLFVEIEFPVFNEFDFITVARIWRNVIVQLRIFGFHEFIFLSLVLGVTNSLFYS